MGSFATEYTINMKLFLDLDGVLVDFDRHHKEKFGWLPDRNDPKVDVDWKHVSETDFFETAPPMPDYMDLLNFARPYNPIILTGVPELGSEKAAKDKVDWVRRHVPFHVPVITTRSKLKANHCEIGDVIVDDWAKHRPRWLLKGGIWVLHKNAAQSIEELKKIGFK